MVLHSELWQRKLALEEELERWTYTSDERLRVGERAMPSKLAAIRRAEQAERELEAVTQHLRRVDEHLLQDFALLPRCVCSKGNALFRAPARPDDPPSRFIRTSSVILANSSRLQRAYDPSPCNEVMVYSPILAHSTSWQQQLVR